LYVRFLYKLWITMLVMFIKDMSIPVFYNQVS